MIEECYVLTEIIAFIFFGCTMKKKGKQRGMIYMRGGMRNAHPIFRCLQRSFVSFYYAFVDIFLHEC